MAKLVLDDIGSTLTNTAATTINNNNTKIEQALENTLSRDGSTPNNMSADIDMNSNDLLNVGIANIENLVLNGQAVVPSDLSALPTSVMLKTTYDPTGVNGDAFNSANITYDPSQTGDVSRSVAVRLRDEYSVKDFGGVADATTVANTAVTTMAAALGYVRFTHGGYKLTTMTIDVPIYFEQGAYITSDALNTITITNIVESSRQFIFRGTGTYSLGQDADSGENARQIHVSWFGAFPTNTTITTDQAPLIQKAINSVGNLRESVIEFDIGNYFIQTAMALTRGCHIKGQGSRRTVFKTDTDGFHVFSTSATACRITGVQFENVTITTRTFSWIRVLHDFCEVDDIYFQSSKFGIILEDGANSAKITNINGVYAVSPAAGSSMILVRSTSNVTIDGVYGTMSTTTGPTALVHVGSGATGNISAVRINNVVSMMPSLLVLLEASGGDIVRTEITGLRYNGSSGTAPAQALKTITSSTFNINYLVITNFIISSYATAGFTFQQDSSGITENVVISSGSILGTSGNGIEFVQTAGTLREFRIDGSVDARERATPYLYSGSNSNIRIDPQALVNVDTTPTYFFSAVADDTAVTLPLRKSFFTGTVIITGGTARHGIFTVRAASSPAVSANRITDANTAALASVLTGTTGTDTNLTLGVQDGVLYAENRTGAALNISITVMAA